MKHFPALFFLAFFILQPMMGQVVTNKESFTEADTLRGSLRPERNYDVLKYHLNVKVEPENRFISGYNTITFKAKESLPVMQLDLFANMQVDSILYKGKKLDYNRKFDAVFIHMEPVVPENKVDSLQFFYSGNPIVAKNAPWDGGFVFDRDEEG
ncbi:MAG TPA: M1 family peptidase, partial [Salinimicrobium catena]|nr:M1 family peptidase [Salinimicrobium catena]